MNLINWATFSVLTIFNVKGGIVAGKITRDSLKKMLGVARDGSSHPEERECRDTLRSYMLNNPGAQRKLPLRKGMALPYFGYRERDSGEGIVCLASLFSIGYTIRLVLLSLS